jgi:hypothetical protein
MNELVVALGPVFAAGFAVQQLLEVLQLLLGKLESCPGKSLLYRFVKKERVASFADAIKANKKLILGAVALVIGLVLAFKAGLRVLKPFDFTGPDLWDAIVTGLVVSAGTEGFNSAVKLLDHLKKNTGDRPEETGKQQTFLEKSPSYARGETESDAAKRTALPEVLALAERA